ncbi:MAG: hypothetical protein AVDCRST_MAG59-3336, partial [uncultured Thermomicrobiales bacterium]
CSRSSAPWRLPTGTPRPIPLPRTSSGPWCGWPLPLRGTRRPTPGPGGSWPTSTRPRCLGNPRGTT